MRRPILLVEDDHDLRYMLAEILESEGHVVVTAGDGRQAFQLAREHHPALIVLDLMMPVMTGEEFRNAQLASSEISSIPVIVLSGQHGAQEVARHMDAAGCLQKPVDFDLVVHLCTHVIATNGM